MTGAEENFFQRLLLSQLAPFKAARGLLVTLAAILAVQSIVLGFYSLSPHTIYKKDLLQDYLMIHAAETGESAYAPMQVLRDKIFPEVSQRVFPHASPHPPQMALMFAPFKSLSYPSFAAVWMCLELLFVLLAVYLFVQLVGVVRWQYIVIAGLVALASYPVRISFMVGSCSTLLLLLGVLIAREWTKDGSWRLGLCLGLAGAIKFFGIPILLFLLWKKRYRPVVIAAATYLISLGAAVAYFGQSVTYQYFAEVLPGIEAFYRSESENQSLLGIAQHVFAGLYPTVMTSVRTAPLLDLPAFEPIARYCLLGLFLIVSGIQIDRFKNENAQVMAILCVSTLATPILWVHSLSPVLPMLGLIWLVLERKAFPAFATGLSALFTVVFIFSEVLKSAFVERTQEVSFLLSLSVKIPLFSALGLLFILVMLERRPDPP